MPRGQRCAFQDLSLGPEDQPVQGMDLAIWSTSAGIASSWSATPDSLPAFFRADRAETSGLPARITW
jgi:hypothetical protein